MLGTDGWPSVWGMADERSAPATGVLRADHRGRFLVVPMGSGNLACADRVKSAGCVHQARDRAGLPGVQRESGAG
ncbi:MAG: hypothetical protein KIT69_10860 [Propionibacteriaceae bacterium]|nr:hypothetical protein [Propionibacteriaceae bacterium]